jgi:hypothetical protein
MQKTQNTCIPSFALGLKLEETLVLTTTRTITSADHKLAGAGNRIDPLHHST